jgi:hypothetical protein
MLFILETLQISITEPECGLGGFVRASFDRSSIIDGVDSLGLWSTSNLDGGKRGKDPGLLRLNTGQKELVIANLYVEK